MNVISSKYGSTVGFRFVLFRNKDVYLSFLRILYCIKSNSPEQEGFIVTSASTVDKETNIPATFSFFTIFATALALLIVGAIFAMRSEDFARILKTPSQLPTFPTIVRLAFGSCSAYDLRQVAMSTRFC